MSGVLALISFKIYPARMGGQKGVALFYEYLSRLTPVHLFTTGDGGHDSVRLYPNKLMPLNLLRRAGMAREAASISPSVVIAEHSYTGWLARRLSRRLGVPFIIHSHNLEYKRFKQMGRSWWNLFRRYESWIHKQADFNFFISEEDQSLAVKEFSLDPSRCMVVTYGVEDVPVTAFLDARQALGFSSDQLICLFNGTLDYAPNVQAVGSLIDQVIPLLRRQLKNFRIVITGSRADAVLIRAMKAVPEIDYRGFVDDINIYYDASDLFLNPVLNDSGVKTKLIESIARGCKAVSMRSGANGLRTELCGDLLLLADDGDWKGFAQHIVSSPRSAHLPLPEFMNYYGWEGIAARAFSAIQNLASHS